MSICHVCEYRIAACLFDRMDRMYRIRSMSESIAARSFRLYLKAILQILFILSSV